MAKFSTARGPRGLGIGGSRRYDEPSSQCRPDDAPIPISDSVYQVVYAQLWTNSSSGDIVLPKPIDIADG